MNGFFRLAFCSNGLAGIYASDGIGVMGRRPML